MEDKEGNCSQPEAQKQGNLWWARPPFLGSWRDFRPFVQVRAGFSGEENPAISTPSQFPSGPVHTSDFLGIDGA